jgi:hypothetical protein
MGSFGTPLQSLDRKGEVEEIPINSPGLADAVDLTAQSHARNRGVSTIPTWAPNPTGNLPDAQKSDTDFAFSR